MTTDERYTEIISQLEAIAKGIPAVLMQSSVSQLARLRLAANQVVNATVGYNLLGAPRDINVTGNRPGTGRVEYRADVERRCEAHLTSEMQKTADVDPKFRPHRDGNIRP